LGKVESSLGDALKLTGSLTHVNHLLRLGLYDTAVREVCVRVESLLRSVLRTDAYGQRLVDDFIEKSDVFGGVPQSVVSIYRSRLKTFFRFVRNVYAHRTVMLSRAAALAMLAHASMLLEDLEEMVGKGASG
jgi:hypothetical protein